MDSVQGTRAVRLQEFTTYGEPRSKPYAKCQLLSLYNKSCVGASYWMGESNAWTSGYGAQSFRNLCGSTMTLNPKSQKAEHGVYDT